MLDHELTRRSFLLFSLCAVALRALSQQGVASRDLKAQAAPPPSGRPFNAHFADIAEAAGLNSPVIYGGVDTKKYILEANGCGCASLTTTMMAGQTSSCFPAPVWKEIRRRRRSDCTETIATAHSPMLPTKRPEGCRVGKWRLRCRLQQ